MRGETGSAQKLALIIVLVSFIIGFKAYPLMPERMASHWNINDAADGSISKPWGLFFFPSLMLSLFLLLTAMPSIDPLKKNFDSFAEHYGKFVLSLTTFMFYAYLLTVLWNLGMISEMTRLLVPAFSLLFWSLGSLMEHVKKNWFVGIRTPWTMSSDTVWAKTHSLGGPLFRACGAIALLGIFLHGYALLVVLVGPVLLSSFYLAAYSYKEYQREHE